MTHETDINVSHLEPSRADTARRAGDEVLTAAQAWATASKQHVGAVVLPRDEGAARAFDAFVGARRELAYHVGGTVAARWAAGALSAASHEPGGGG